MLTTLDKAVGTCLRTLLGVCASLLLLAQPSVHLVGEAHATAQTSTIWPSFRTGTVYTRNFVRGPNGERIFAEFGADGRVVREIGEAVGDYANAVAMSGDAYRNAVQAYDRVLDELGETDAQGAYILSREAYDRTNFTTLSGTPVTNKPGLYGSTKSVLVRNARKLLTPGTSPLLLESTIDLQNRQELQERIKSVLLTPGGQVLVSSEHNIGYRSAFVKPTGGDPGECSPAYGPEEDSRKYRNVSKDDVCGPVGGALITAQVLPGREGGTLSDPAGHYSLSYLLYPCPGFDIEYTNYFIPKFYYTAFNPKGERRPGMYYQVTQVYDWCFGSHELLKHSGNLAGLSAYLNAEAILSTLAEPSKRLDIGIDVMAVTGVGRLGNTEAEADAIPLGQTRYTTDLPTFTPGNPEGLDLDGDRTDDTILDLQGLNIVDASGAAVTVEPNSVAVYLGDKQPEYDDTGNLRNTYDLIRKKDTAPDTEHQGLLSELSTEDLEATDLYVYRTSNDQLIFERKGLDPNEDGYQRGQGGGAVEGSEAAFYYYSVLRGPYGNNTYFQKDFETWQADSGMNPDLYARDADHLRIGETIKLIAVNRKTGYIGTATAQVGNAAQNGSGRIDFPIPDIVMRPPNLKIKAERSYNIQAGLTKDEEREYLIGFEGSGLASDRIISISTEWLDHDGTPLPADLPGYTARLAKIVGDQTLGDNLAEFELKTGTHLQLIRLPDDAVLSNDHFYVHVAGSPPEDSPNFSSTGAGDGVLASRPRHYVPILVPVFDEVETRARRNQQRYAREDGTLNDDEPRAEGVYTWVYRPEMQFSVLDLTVQALNRTDSEGNTVDVYPAGSDANPDTIPGFASSDQYAQLLYTLLMGGYAPLDSLGYTDPNRTTLDPENTTGREYLFAFGEEETYATFGEDQVARFDNVGHLAALDVDDYLTIRLIQNTDAENVLWEFAFEYLYLDTQFADYDAQNSNVLYVSADEPEVPLQAALIGFASRKEENKYPVTINWSVDGDGALEQTQQRDDDVGVFFNNLTMASVTGARATVIAQFQAEPPVRATLGEIVVVPGKPAHITTDITGDASVAGVGALNLNVSVYDQHLNRVANSTPVDITINGEGIVPIYDGGTVNGVMSAQIKGGHYPGDYTVTVKADDVTQSYPITIHPLSVQFASVPNTVIPGETAAVTVRVTGHDGQPVVNQPVDLFSDGGFVDVANAVTDSTGQVTLNYVAGFKRGTVNLKARAGLSPPATASITQEFPPPQNPNGLETQGLIVVGEAAQAGTVDYERYDLEVLTIPYTHQTSVSVSGAAGETVTVNLGTLTDPNIAPVAVYPLRAITAGQAVIGQGVLPATSPDAVGRWPAEVDGATVSNDSPRGAGAGSTLFGSADVMRAPENGSFNVQRPGLRFDIKPIAAGTVLEQGPLHVAYQNGRIEAVLVTDQGSFTQTSALVAAGSWHSVGLRYDGASLDLEVDGQLRPSVAATGGLTYLAGARLTVGGGFAGHLANLKWFDYSSGPLLTFANGQATETVTFATAGSQSLTVQSTGRMNQAPGSSLDVQRVGVSDGSLRLFVNLMSRAAYAEFAGHYATTAYQGTELPPINVAALTDPHYERPGNGFFIRNAYAATSLLDGFISVVSSVAEYLLPIEDMRIVYEQVNLAIAGSPNFDPVKLAISSLSVMTYLPGPTALLRPVAVPLRKFYQLMSRNSRAMKALAGVLDDIVTKAKRGNWDAISSRVSSMVPFFLVAAEMLAEPEGLNIMIDAIQSTDDLWTWVDYFNLPADGWEGDGAIPDVELASVQSATNGMHQWANSVLGFVVSPAHAAKPPRIDGRLLARALRDAVANLGPDIRANPQFITMAMRGAKEALTHTLVQSLRKLVTDPRFVTAITAVSARNGIKRVKNFLLGYTDARIPAPLFIGIIAYLESEYAHERLGVTHTAGGRIREELFKKYAVIMKDIVAGNPRVLDEEQGTKDDEDNLLSGEFSVAHDASALLNGSAHGAMFHVAMVAYYELANQNIKSIESYRSVWAYKDKDSASTLGTAGVYRKYGRYVDIVLADSEATAAPESWVELKSLKANQAKLRETVSSGFSKWKFAKKDSGSGYKYHKQYVLDRIATKLKRARTSGKAGNEPIGITGMKWWFHKFKTTPKGQSVVYRSPKLGDGANDDGSIKYKLSDLPTSLDSKALFASLVISSVKGNDAYRNELGDVIEEASIKNLVLEKMGDELIPGGDDIRVFIRENLIEE
ncbi:MAG TPA: hypothetical protein VIR60_04955 [Gammaproteobacteria bacterium]